MADVSITTARKGMRVWGVGWGEAECGCVVGCAKKKAILFWIYEKSLRGNTDNAFLIATPEKIKF